MCCSDGLQKTMQTQEWTPTGTVLGQGAHLVIVVHGMWGRPVDVLELANTIQLEGGDSSTTWVPDCNYLLKTYQGVDVCGLRLANDIQSMVQFRNLERPGGAENSNQPAVTRLSLLGYSAGGLFVRYALGLLWDRGFFGEGQAVRLEHVVTVATPHLGVRNSPKSLFGRARNGLLGGLANLYGGRTLEQMCLQDRDGGPPPLLMSMALPDSSYIKALRLATSVHVYANALNDNTVPYCTAAIARRNIYKGNGPRPPLVSGYQYVAEPYLIHDAPGQWGIADDPGSEEAARAPEQTSPNPDPAAPSATPPLGKSIMDAATLAVLSPLILVHAVVVITPLRLFAATKPSPPVSQPTVTPTQEPVGQPAGTHSGSAGDVPGGLAGSSGAVEVPPVEQIPALIRESLSRPELGIKRVDVFLPGVHTHGTIVVRRVGLHNGGREVLRHVAKALHGATQNGGALAPTDASELGLLPTDVVRGPAEAVIGAAV